MGGKQLVSKKAFETGATTTLFDEMMSLCQVSGWLNETIGSYTCTKDCGPPTNYSEIFTYDWEESENATIGSKVKYVLLLSLDKQETCHYIGMFATTHLKRW